MNFFRKVLVLRAQIMPLGEKKKLKKLPELDTTILDEANCCQSFKINPI